MFSDMYHISNYYMGDENQGLLYSVSNESYEQIKHILEVLISSHES